MATSCKKNTLVANRDCWLSLGFAWSKLGVGAAVKDIRPDQVTGVVKPVNGRCPAGWIKLGTSALGYEPGNFIFAVHDF